MTPKKTTEVIASETILETTPVPPDTAADLAAMLAEARQLRAEAQALFDRVQAGQSTLPDPAALEADRLWGEEPVEIQLFRDNGMYRDDVFVSVNGEAIAIQRGKPVTVKRKFAEILENSRRQDDAAARLMEQQEKQFRAAGL